MIMKKKMNVKKRIALIVIFTFLMQLNGIIYSQSEDEIVRQFQKAKERYVSGQINHARMRIERIIGIVNEKGIQRKDILGECFLLLGAINEKESKPVLAEEYYRKAMEECGIISVAEVDLSGLVLFRKIVKGELDPRVITGPGVKKKKKKFPWMYVAGGVIVTGVLVYFLFLKKKKSYNVTVELGEGVEGTPDAGTISKKKGERIDYNYSLKAGYSNLVVYLDGQPITNPGSFEVSNDHTLRAVATSNDVQIVTDTDRVEVPEKQSATFRIRLSAQPVGDVTVTTVWESGDNDITVSGGNAHTFTSSNWNEYKTVTLSAREDEDYTSDEATILLSASGLDDKRITAVEVDTSIQGFVTDTDKLNVDEKGTASFKVKLLALPTEPVTAYISKLEGDRHIYVKKDYATLTFNSENYDQYQKVLVGALEDEDAENGTATIRISADGINSKDVQVTEIDADSLHFVVEPLELSINEKQTASFTVRLSAQTSNTITVGISRRDGDNSIDVQENSRNLTFTTEDWNQPKTVVIEAKEDPDATNGVAYIQIQDTSGSVEPLPDRIVTVTEIDDKTMELVLSASALTVVEEGTVQLQVNLSAQPESTATVNIKYASGDTDITQEPDSLVFNASNWDVPQSVIFSAKKDEDEENGQAVFNIKSSQIPTETVTITEEDTGPGTPPEVSIKEPVNGANVDGDVLIKVVADDDFKVERVEFYIDDNLVDSDTEYPYRYTWPTMDAALGQHTIKVIAYDTIGQTNEGPEEITVYVVDTEPTGEIRLPAHTPLAGTETIEIEANDYRGLKSVRLLLDGTELTAWTSGGQTQVSINYSLDTTAYANGQHTLTLEIIDTSDNKVEVPAVITIGN